MMMMMMMRALQILEDLFKVKGSNRGACFAEALLLDFTVAQ